MIGTFNIAWHRPGMAPGTFEPRRVWGLIYGPIGIQVRGPDSDLRPYLEGDELLPDYPLIHIPSGMILFTTEEKAIARHCATALAPLAPDPWPLPFGVRATGNEAELAAFRAAVHQLRDEVGAA